MAVTSARHWEMSGKHQAAPDQTRLGSDRLWGCGAGRVAPRPLGAPLAGLCGARGGPAGVLGIREVIMGVEWGEGFWVFLKLLGKILFLIKVSNKIF